MPIWLERRTPRTPRPPSSLWPGSRPPSLPRDSIIRAWPLPAAVAAVVGAAVNGRVEGATMWRHHLSLPFRRRQVLGSRTGRSGVGRALGISSASGASRSGQRRTRPMATSRVAKAASTCRSRASCGRMTADRGRMMKKMLPVATKAKGPTSPTTASGVRRAAWVSAFGRVGLHKHSEGMAYTPSLNPRVLLLCIVPSQTATVLWIFRGPGLHNLRSESGLLLAVGLAVETDDKCFARTTRHDGNVASPIGHSMCPSQC